MATIKYPNLETMCSTDIAIVHDLQCKEDSPEYTQSLNLNSGYSTSDKNRLDTFVFCTERPKYPPLYQSMYLPGYSRTLGRGSDAVDALKGLLKIDQALLEFAAQKANPFRPFSKNREIFDSAVKYDKTLPQNATRVLYLHNEFKAFLRPTYAAINPRGVFYLVNLSSGKIYSGNMEIVERATARVQTEIRSITQGETGRFIFIVQLTATPTSPDSGNNFEFASRVLVLPKKK